MHDLNWEKTGPTENVRSLEVNGHQGGTANESSGNLWENIKIGIHPNVENEYNAKIF